MSKIKPIKDTQPDKIDQAIFYAETEVKDVAELIPLKTAKKKLDKKYYDKA